MRKTIASVATLCSLLLATPVYSDNNSAKPLQATQLTKKTTADSKAKKYKSWIKKCKQFSKKKKNCLVVDKKARQMELYQNGKKTASYTVELGAAPLEDKTKEGDGRTPEGFYKIRFVNTWSSFYKGLRVGYPNHTDWKEFRSLKKKGKLAKYDTIGSAIEIHGSGGTTTKSDWTAGCIALSNGDIDNLYKRLKLSGRVVKPKQLKTIRVAIVPYRK